MTKPGNEIPAAVRSPCLAVTLAIVLYHIVFSGLTTVCSLTHSRIRTVCETAAACGVLSFLHAAGLLLTPYWIGSQSGFLRWLRGCGLLSNWMAFKADVGRMCHAIVCGIGMYAAIYIARRSNWVSHSSDSQTCSAIAIIASLLSVLVEEVVLTGYVFRLARQRRSFVSGAAITSLPVLVLHWQIVSHSIVGIDTLMLVLTTAVFCAYLEISSTLFPSIAAHLGYNCAWLLAGCG